VIELDAHFWQPGLVATPPAQWALVQQELVGGEKWVIDGNLGDYDLLDIRLKAADTVIVLDFSLARCAYQALRRGRERADFWRWLLTYRRRQRPLIMAAIASEAASADLHLLRNPRALALFLARLSDSAQV
jgi:hypothetical protein